jgi:hypothetical protein
MALSMADRPPAIDVLYPETAPSISSGSGTQPTADATEPTWNGYLLTVACSCGMTFERWITPWDAELELLRIARLN